MVGSLILDYAGLALVRETLSGMSGLIGSSAKVRSAPCGDPALDEAIARFSRACGQFGEQSMNVLAARANSASEISSLFRDLDRSLAAAAPLLGGGGGGDAGEVW